MKVLLVHNFYGSSAPSGENSVVLAEQDLLRKNGHEVVAYTRHSDGIRNQGLRGMIRGAFATAWNPFARKDLGELIRREQPEVMHVHNTFPLVSPSIFHAAMGSNTAMVFTLHNYRIFCPCAILMRDGAACTECIENKSAFGSIRYGCYRDSRLATLPLALSVALHRKLGTWSNKVDAFITLTEFQRGMVVRAGLPAEQVFVKPNFYPDPPSPQTWEARENQAVFIGRLSLEKGVKYLVQAWKRWGAAAPRLDIIGDGPDRAALENEAKGSNIRFLGQQPFDKVQEQLSRSRMLILPSVCYEGFPMVIREAFALGVPVAASRIGSLPHIVDDGKNGVLFDPGNADDLVAVVKRNWTDGMLEPMSKAARAKFDKEYTAGENYKMLMGIYEKALARRRAA